MAPKARAEALFEEYLKEIGLTDAFRSRVREAMSLFEASLGRPPEDILVSEFLDEAGARQLESVWMFLDDVVSEAMLTGEPDRQIDFVPLTRNVRHVVVKSRTFDPENAGDEAQLSIMVWFSDQRYGELRATAGNAARLWRLTRARLLKNLSPGSAAG